MKEKTKSGPLAASLAVNLRGAVKSNSKTILTALIYALGSFVFSTAELVFETYPLGLAFYCSVTDNLPAALAGVILGYAVGGGNTLVYCAGILISTCFRFALSYALNRKDVSLLRVRDGMSARISSALAGGFTVSLIRIIYGGFRYYDLLAGVFFLLCVSGAVFAYSSFMERENAYTQKYEAGAAAVMFSIVLACRQFTVGGISASSVAAFFLTLFTARKGGALRGTVTGFLCGAAIDPALCPMFGAVGFLCGLFTSFAAYIGVMFSLIAGLFCGVYINGFETLTGYLPEAAISAALYLPFQYFGGLRGVDLFEREAVPAAVSDARAAACEDELEAMRIGLRRLADAFGSLSEIASDLSLAERTPDCEELSRLCRKCFDEICSQCPKRETCPAASSKITGAEYERMGAAIYEKKSFAYSDVPRRIRAVCDCTDGTAVKINIACARLLEDRAKNDRAGVISYDAGLFSKLLKRFYRESGEKYGENEEAAARLKKRSACSAVFHGGVSVCGDRKKYVVASGGDMIKVRNMQTEIRKSFEAALSVRLSEPEIVNAGGSAVFKAETRAVISCEAAKAERVKDGEIINGDTAFYLRGRDDRFYGAVCDGMGSGRDAALASKLSSVILDKLISAGCGASEALDAVNHIIRQKRTECFTTVDMIEIDLLTGGAVFYKCGAAPSFILRGGKVFRIASYTPPVGIMGELCAEKIEFSLAPDDVVIMLSDGVADAGDQLTGILSALDDDTPEIAAASILDEAVNLCGRRDDMTVLAIKIRRSG